MLRDCGKQNGLWLWAIVPVQVWKLEAVMQLVLGWIWVELGWIWAELDLAGSGQNLIWARRDGILDQWISDGILDQLQG